MNKADYKQKMDEKGENPTTENNYSKDFKVALTAIFSDNDDKVLESQCFGQVSKQRMKYESLK